MTNKKRQAAGSATAAGAASADAIKTAATTADDREFTRLYRQASPSGRKQIGHLVYALVARSERRMFACAYHWAAFVAINPVVAFRAVPTLQRITRICIVAAAVGVMLALMTACSGDNAGGDSSAAALRAKYGQPARVANNAETTQPATPTPQIIPTVVPPVEVTRIIEVTRETQPAGAPVVEVTRVVVATPTPQPCDTLQPMPTVELSESDRAAGVVLRGQWQPCAYQTAAASEVQP